MKRLFKRLATLATLAGIATGAVALSAHADDKVIRIGFQKYGTLVLLKAKGTLEEKLAPLGYTVKWTEFPAGPQLLEALNVGAIDFGTTGEAPPIFAQAAGAPLVYVGYEPPAPKGEAILVPKDSPLKTVADLKGKNGRAQQGLERPLSARQGAREGRRRLFRHQDLLPAAGRCARRVREGRGRCLGDLGSLPRRGRGGDRRAPARRRHRHRLQPPVLPRCAAVPGCPCRRRRRHVQGDRARSTIG